MTDQTEGENAAARFAALLQGCESEQLHLSGAIQSFGAMLRIDTITSRVTHASANLADYVGTPAADLLGRHVSEIGWLSPDDFPRLEVQAGKTLSVVNLLEDASGSVDARLIRGTDAILIEIERNSMRAEPLAIYLHQRPLMNPPGDLDDLEEYHRILLEAFHAVTGFGRVMIYRFQDDWSGEVVAERTGVGMGSYLGLHFPASDIPAIARDLYMINPARMIPDVAAPTVPVLGISAEPPDLTWSDLRSVSPVHLQYLQHMKVGASFSVPIRVAGRLWGLVACHHESSRLLSPDQRSVCVTLTNTYALGLTSYHASRRLQMLDSLERRTSRVLEALADFSDPLDGIETNGQVLIDSLAAQGFAMAVMNDVVIVGNGPDLDGMGIIDAWFMDECPETLFATDRLAELFYDYPQLLAAASGMVAIKASSRRSGWVRFYWFRPAEPQEVAWAGNPNKAEAAVAGALALSPRSSFERWVEMRTDYARAWSNEDTMVASKYRNNLLRWL